MLRTAHTAYRTTRASQPFLINQTGVDFRSDVPRDFHRELIRVEVMSRVAGCGSSCWGFFLSGFGGGDTVLEAEAVIAGL